MPRQKEGQAQAMRLRPGQQGSAAGPDAGRGGHGEVTDDPMPPSPVAIAVGAQLPALSAPVPVFPPRPPGHCPGERRARKLGPAPSSFTPKTGNWSRRAVRQQVTDLLSSEGAARLLRSEKHGQPPRHRALRSCLQTVLEMTPDAWCRLRDVVAGGASGRERGRQLLAPVEWGSRSLAWGQGWEGSGGGESGGWGGGQIRISAEGELWICRQSEMGDCDYSKSPFPSAQLSDGAEFTGLCSRHRSHCPARLSPPLIWSLVGPFGTRLTTGHTARPGWPRPPPGVCPADCSPLSGRRRGLP